MKKNHLFGMFAMAAFAFASCSQDEVVTQSPEVNKAIEFGTYVGRDAVSRGSVITQGGSTAGADNATITTDALAEKGFGVFAYYTDEGDYVAATTTASETVAAAIASPCNFMYNQEVKGVATKTGEGESAVTAYSTTDWTYSPVKYWPNDPGDKLTFFAYAPYDDADDNISFNAQADMKGDPIITFKVNNDVKKQQDLLISKTNNINKCKNPSTGTGIKVDDKVSFQFAHALARIGFTVKAITDEVEAGTTPKKLDEATTIVLKKVVLYGGSKVTGNDEPTATSNAIFYTQGELNLNQQNINVKPENSEYIQVAWANIVGDGDTDTKQMFTLENANFKAQTDKWVVYDNEGFVITGGENGNSTTANPLNADDSYIMIIPQDLSTDGFYVYVEYDVITQDANLGFNASAENLTYGDLKSKITNHISNQVKINFQSGKAYKLNLQLGMTSVKVTADVDPWVDGGSTSVDLPQNTPTPTPPAQEGGTES